MALQPPNSTVSLKLEKKNNEKTPIADMKRLQLMKRQDYPKLRLEQQTLETLPSGKLT
jgi:hypothetical protein